MLWLFAFFQLSLALPWHAALHAPTAYPLTVVGSFPQPHTFENIATRHNGQLLLTSTVSPTLYHVDPLQKNHIASVIGIPRTTALLGIAELEQDVFYVVSANMSSVSGIPGSNAVWRLDMRGRSSLTEATERLSLVANITSAQLLNGICRISDHDTRSLLIADSQAGRIFKLDTRTGYFQVVIDDEVLKKTPEGLQVAVNGLHVQGSHLYFTSLNKGIFGRYPISLSTGIPTGPVEIIAEGVRGDDFAVSADGKFAWIAMNGQSSLIEVDISARSARVVVESAALASASAVSFGRTLLDMNSLYISSAGTLNATTGANATATGGIIARVDIL